MRSKALIFTIILTGLLSLASCQNESEVQAIGGVEYFPIETGDVKMYEVQEITWNSFLDTGFKVIYDIRQEIKAPFVNSDGDTVLRVEWSKYDSITGGFSVYKAFTMSADKYTGQVTDDNIRAIKLSFPIVKNKSWDGNLFNSDKGSKDYKYLKVFEPFYTPYAGYGQTVTVREAQDVLNGIRVISKKSVYAKGIGMVYHEDIDYEIISLAGGGHTKEGKETFIILK